MTVFGMISLLAGVGVILRWNHLRAEVLSQPAALIGLVVGVLTVLLWIAFTLRRVLWATISDGSQLLGGRPIVALHHGTAELGFSMLGVLRARATAAFAALAGAGAVAIYLPVEAGSLLIAAGTSRIGALSCLMLMLALVPALLWLAHHRAATTSVPAPVEV